MRELNVEDIKMYSYPEANSNGIRLVHKPTNTEVIVTKHKLPYRNREEAFAELFSELDRKLVK